MVVVLLTSCGSGDTSDGDDRADADQAAESRSTDDSIDEDDERTNAMPECSNVLKTPEANEEAGTSLKLVRAQIPSLQSKGIEHDHCEWRTPDDESVVLGLTLFGAAHREEQQAAIAEKIASGDQEAIISGFPGVHTGAGILVSTSGISFHLDTYDLPGPQAEVLAERIAARLDPDNAADA